MADENYLTIDHLDRKTIARLFSKIQINRETGCWDWTGSAWNGYGKMWLRAGRKLFTHRIMYAWTIGPIPTGRRRTIPVVDHMCNNPKCCNPVHLDLTTHRRNVLRSQTGPSAVNKRKTHCSKGHELPSEANRRNGKRQCPECARTHDRNRTNTDARREAAKQRYQRSKVAETAEHRSHRKATQRAYQNSEAGKAAFVAWREKNREKIRAYQREWARNH